MDLNPFTLVAFDEFRTLFAVGGGIDGLFRSRIQRHGDAASFAGSHDSLMELFNERTLTRFNLSKGGAQHARDKLARMGHLQEVGGEWQPVDPLLTEWVARLERRVDRGRPR